MTNFGPGSYYDYLGYTIAEDAIDNSIQYQDELDEQQDELDEIREDVARRKTMEEFQSWIEEFIYKFSKAVTNISSGSKNPVSDYNVITSFLDIINKNSINTASIRGLENKYVFEQTFLKSQGMFVQLKKKPEVQKHLRQQEKARLEQERIRSEARKETAVAIKKARQSGRSGVVAKLQKWFGLDNHQQDNDKENQFNLGNRYYKGQGVKQDYQEALKWFRLAADQGLREAQFNLGVMYSSGQGVKQDKQEATKWFLLAADQGLNVAQYNLGCHYQEGEGVQQNYSESIKWFRLAADQGLREAQFNLGVMYSSGQGVKQDKQEAIKWYRLAADQGNKEAKTKIQELERNLTPKDTVPRKSNKSEVKKQVSTLYDHTQQDMRDETDPETQFAIGYQYFLGMGTTRDYNEAVKWFRLAANQCNVFAQYFLGTMYMDGRGVNQDYSEAAKWCRLAADQGYAIAQNNLGNMYANGLGVTQDYTEAVKWLRLAANHGNEEAKKKLLELEKASTRG